MKTSNKAKSRNFTINTSTSRYTASLRAGPKLRFDITQSTYQHINISAYQHINTSLSCYSASLRAGLVGRSLGEVGIKVALRHHRITKFIFTDH